ncbi:MAG TPA: O-methyltransferase [Terriglobales bacterium]|nr:O-methyltransferase [Terriglobales bacterium]
MTKFNQSNYPDAHPITGPEVENYLYAMLPPRDSVLTEMEQKAIERKIPIVGPVIGRLFELLAQISGAETVFELGSAIGYSTIWWARAVGKTGRVHYTDGSAQNAQEARGYFERAGVADQVDVSVGDALEILSEQKEQFDIIFCDIDKEDYPRALRLAKNFVRSGGLFVADNVLWSGRVVYAAGNPEIKTDPQHHTKQIVEFNQMLANSPEWYSVMLPVRDGVTVARRL